LTQSESLRDQAAWKPLSDGAIATMVLELKALYGAEVKALIPL
jgi:hypothetical protein